MYDYMEEEKLLGKEIGYPKSYRPEILVAVPRKLNREIYGIHRPEALFYGYDTWHCYEASCLTKQGLPIAGILKLVYRADSEFLVESKSLKLYLGSFNMTRLGNTPEEAATLFEACVARDLSRLLHTEVRCRFYSGLPETQPFDFPGYTVLEELDCIRQGNYSDYHENPDLLSENIKEEKGEVYLCSHLLKSNCKITRQPDWGSIYIRIRAGRLPDEPALLRYIVSLRDENHFHEEICEMIFKRLTDIFRPSVLTVSCLYTRRGGIDICPSRSNHPALLPIFLPDVSAITRPAFRQ